jgi:hypothetical protein
VISVKKLKFLIHHHHDLSIGMLCVFYLISIGKLSIPYLKEGCVTELQHCHHDLHTPLSSLVVDICHQFLHYLYGVHILSMEFQK